MSLDLPPEVTWVMNMLGLPWPDIDEDQLRSYATHLRTFASELDDTHGAARSRISSLSEGYSGASYEALVERWAEATSSHMSELVTGCNDFATALDVAADGVVAIKSAVIAALVAMAAEFVADQAAAAFTFGLSEAAIPALVAGTRAIVKKLLDQLEQEIIGQALNAAIGPLEDKVDASIQGLVLQGLQSALS
jgi:hypothetical protein